MQFCDFIPLLQPVSPIRHISPVQSRLQNHAIFEAKMLRIQVAAIKITNRGLRATRFAFPRVAAPSGKNTPDLSRRTQSSKGQVSLGYVHLGAFLSYFSLSQNNCISVFLSLKNTRGSYVSHEKSAAHNSP